MPATAITIPDEDVNLLLHDVSWETYEQLRDEIDSEHRHLRLTYNDGVLEMMSPSDPHERWKLRIGRMIELMALELQIDIEGLGSTTFRRKIKRKGLEPDECYYVQNASAVRDGKLVDLKIHPPPDLVVEVDYSNSSLPREPVYAGLGMPELWRFDGDLFRVRLLGKDGKYHDSPSSSAFPFLPMDRFAAFFRRMDRESPNSVLLEFREWVRTLRI